MMVTSMPLKTKVVPKEQEMVQIASEDRYGSATSKGSRHSDDSGFSLGDGSTDDLDEYANIITEESDAQLVAELEKEFNADENLGK